MDQKQVQYFTQAGLGDQGLSHQNGLFHTFLYNKIGLTPYDSAKPQDYNAFLTELKSYLSSEKLTIAGKQALLAEFERVHVPKRKIAAESDVTNPFATPEDKQKAAQIAQVKNDQEYAQELQAFEKLVNVAFGAPEGNPWRDTLAGLTSVSKTASAPQKTEKTRNDHTSAISASNDQNPSLQTAGVSAKTAEGHVMAVVTSPVVNDGQLPTTTELAEKLTRTMAMTSKPSDIVSIVDKEGLKEAETAVFGEASLSFAAFRTFQAKGGYFDVVAIGSPGTTIIAYNPNYNIAAGASSKLTPDQVKAARFQTITWNPDRGETSIVRKSLPEGSIILVLTSDILENLPSTGYDNINTYGTRHGSRQINFEALIRGEFDDKRVSGNEFEIPSNLNENTLMVAFANQAAKNKFQAKSKTEYQEKNWQQESDGKKPVNFFIMGIELSNELETNHWLSPANWTPFAVVGLGIGFGLKFFAPELFAAAAPYLTPIILGFVSIAAVALVAYVISTIVKDIDNQWKSRKVETPGKDEGKIERVKNYLFGITARISDWLSKHPIQVTMGVIAFALMVTIIGLGFWWIVSPMGMDMSIAGPFIKSFFDLVAQVIAGGSPIGVDVTVGSAFNQIFAVLATAFVSVVVVDSIRRFSTYLYEKFAGIRTPDLDRLMDSKAVVSDRLSQQKGLEDRKENPPELYVLPANHPYHVTDTSQKSGFSDRKSYNTDKVVQKCADYDSDWCWVKLIGSDGKMTGVPMLVVIHELEEYRPLAKEEPQAGGEQFGGLFQPAQPIIAQASTVLYMLPANSIYWNEYGNDKNSYEPAQYRTSVPYVVKIISGEGSSNPQIEIVNEDGSVRKGHQMIARANDLQPYEAPQVNKEMALGSSGDSW